MIPKFLHFIWIGKNLPDEFKKYLIIWKKLYPTWTIKVWSEDDILNDNIIPNVLLDVYYNNTFPVAFKADISRYCILKKYGGLYFDVDFEPLKPIPNSFLQFSFLGGIQNNGETAIGFIGAKANSDVICDVLSTLPTHIESMKNGRYYKPEYIHKITGPEFFSPVVNMYKNRDDCFFFTYEYFYPYWESERNRKHEDFRVTSPLSFAVHHWKSSWKYLY